MLEFVVMEIARKPVIHDGHISVHGIEGVAWSHSAKELLGSEWDLHVLPVGESLRETGWEQIAPIPVFQRTEGDPDSEDSVVHLTYATDFAPPTFIVGRTLGEAEATMRGTLPFTMDIVQFSPQPVDPVVQEKANEIAKYFTRKTDGPK